MKPFKLCWCRDSETGRLLGKKCPDLGKRHHGKWYSRYEAPAAPGEIRRQPRIGPFDTEAECKAALKKVAGAATRSNKSYDRKITFGEYLEKRHAWRVGNAELGEGVKRSTLKTDREIIDLYLKPGLGHLKMLDELGPDQIRELYTTILKINRESAKGRQPEMLRRLLRARATLNGKRASRRPVGKSRIKRVHIVLNAALNDAVKVSKIIPENPARDIFRSKGGTGRTGKARPLLWTDERVAEWERTGRAPAKVMVWSAEQSGAFLDFAEHDRLYAMWHLDAFWGMRRGELVNLEKPDASIDRRRLHIREGEPDDDLDDPKEGIKTENADRIIVFDQETARVLTA